MVWYGSYHGYPIPFGLYRVQMATKDYYSIENFLLHPYLELFWNLNPVPDHSQHAKGIYYKFV